MDVSFFSAKHFEKEVFARHNASYGFKLHYFDTHLNEKTAALAGTSPVVCAFVSDSLGRKTLEILAHQGCKMIALRSAGFNHVDLKAARDLGMVVTRVPAYSPHAIAEHTIALILGLNRKVFKAYNRVRDGNFSLEGLVGFDLYQKKVGVIGTGLIGSIVARILLGFGCKVFACDPKPNAKLTEWGVEYGVIDDLLQISDIVTLHCPLNRQTRHLIDSDRVGRMKKGVMLINTGRGALIDTKAVIQALKSGQIGHLGLDVYEEEGPLFFEDNSDHVIGDDVFMRLLTFPNVLVTGHQAFLTHEALDGIASSTLHSIHCFENGDRLVNQLNVTESS